LLRTGGQNVIRRFLQEGMRHRVDVITMSRHVGGECDDAPGLFVPFKPAASTR